MDKKSTVTNTWEFIMNSAHKRWLPWHLCGHTRKNFFSLATGKLLKCYEAGNFFDQWNSIPGRMERTWLAHEYVTVSDSCRKAMAAARWVARFGCGHAAWVQIWKPHTRTLLLIGQDHPIILSEIPNAKFWLVIENGYLKQGICPNFPTAVVYCR